MVFIFQNTPVCVIGHAHCLHPYFRVCISMCVRAWTCTTYTVHTLKNHTFEVIKTISKGPWHCADAQQLEVLVESSMSRVDNKCQHEKFIRGEGAGRFQHHVLLPEQEGGGGKCSVSQLTCFVIVLVENAKKSVCACVLVCVNNMCVRIYLYIYIYVYTICSLCSALARQRRHTT